MTVADVFLIIGVALWIAVAVVVSNPPNGGKKKFDISVPSSCTTEGHVFTKPDL